MVAAVIRADRCPVASVDLVAYFARYAATASRVIGWSAAARTGRTSAALPGSPHPIVQPLGCSACGAVTKAVCPIASVTAWARTNTDAQSGGGITRSLSSGSSPSRRISAW